MFGKWMRRRWYEFRNGHGIYLSFLLSFTNFFLITYSLLVSEVPFLRGLFPELWMFGVVGLFVYVPVAVFVGRWHNKRQLGIDSEIAALANPVTVRLLECLERIERKVDELEKR